MSKYEDSIFGGILPFIGFRDLSQEDCLELELNLNCKWESFSIEWLGICFLVFCREKVEPDARG